MFKFKIIILWLFFICISLNLFATDVIEIIEENESMITFKVNVPEYNLIEEKKGDKLYKRIEGKFDGCLSEPGYPLIPFLSARLGVPEDGDIDFKIIDIKKHNISDVLIVPSDELDWDDDEVVNNFSYKAYNNNVFYPIKNIQKSDRVFGGNRAFVSMTINPFRFLAKRKILEVATSMIVQIRINGSKNRSGDIAGRLSYLDKYGKDFFINNETSKYWRKTRKVSESVPRTRDGLMSAVQFIVDEEGIYKIDYNYLVDSLLVLQDSIGFSMAFDWENVDPRYFELTNENGAVPIIIHGEEDGSFDSGDYIEFYGNRHYGDHGYMDEHTEENVYTLSLKNYIGSRMSYENGGIISEDLYGYQCPDSYKYKEHFEKQLTLFRLGFYNLTSGEQIPRDRREDIFFWKSITAPALDRTPFYIEYPSDGGQERFSSVVNLVGTSHPRRTSTWSENDHHVIVSINSSIVGEKYWLGQREAIFSSDNEHPNEFLVHGENNLYITLLGDTYFNHEQVVLDYFDLTYWREYKTDFDELRFSKPDNLPNNLYEFKIKNFSSDDVSIYKIGSSIIGNYQVEPFTETGGAPYSIVFQDSVYSNSVQYYIVTEEKKKKPKYIRADVTSNLRNHSNRAEYLVITSSEFVRSESTIRLKNLWESKGKIVKVIDVQDIYDEFNFGIRSSEAIKDFISFVYNNWQIPQLTHVLLMGEGCLLSPTDSANSGYDIIPTHTVWTKLVGATVSDSWYGCIVGDDIIPDISVGRINIWEESQLKNYVDKVEYYFNNLNYNNLWHSDITLAAGGKASDGIDVFSRQSEALRRNFIPKEYNVERVYTTTQTVSNEYHGGTFALKNNINNGTSYVQFMGHGGGRVWADYNLFNLREISSLNNKNYPIFCSLSCYSGTFDNAGINCIGESLVLTPNKGGIGHLGFTGLGYLYADEYWCGFLLEAMFKKRFSTMGESLNYTIAKFYSSFYNQASGIALTVGASYLGDSMIGLVYPEKEINVNIENNQYQVNVNDTIRIVAKCPNDILFAKVVVCNENEITINVPYDIPVIDGIIRYNFKLLSEHVNNISKFDVRIYGYSNDREVFGMTSFTSGVGAAVEVASVPKNPTLNDKVKIKGKFFHKDGISTLRCYQYKGVSNDDLEYTMSWNETENCFITDNYIESANIVGVIVRYYFKLTTDKGETETIVEDKDVDGNNIMYSYVISGKELKINNMILSQTEGSPTIKTMITNIGDLEAIDFKVSLYKINEYDEEIFVSELNINSLKSLETKSYEIPFNAIKGYVKFKLYVDKENMDIENNPNDNVYQKEFILNLFEIGENSIIAESIDENFEISFPKNILQGTVYTSLSSVDSLVAVNQNKLNFVALRNELEFLRAYKIEALDYGLFQDTLGTFENNKNINIKFKYSLSEKAQREENEDSYFVYRWNEKYRKWIYQSGFIDKENNEVTLDVNRLGTYALFKKEDYTSPIIDINVENQNFVINGLVASNGVFSLLVSDESGIDVMEHNIEIFINDVQINKDDYSTSVQVGQLIQIPVKYQIDLDKGNYNLSAHAVDVNGNYAQKSVKFRVNKGLDIKRVANYPNPVKSKTVRPDYSGRTRFTYRLTDSADKVYLKIYTVSGRLVKTFRNLPNNVGYHEYPEGIYAWDCKDEKDQYLANGVYFYKLIAEKNGKKIEKIQKMAILK